MNAEQDSEHRHRHYLNRLTYNHLCLQVLLHNWRQDRRESSPTRITSHQNRSQLTGPNATQVWRQNGAACRWVYPTALNVGPHFATLARSDRMPSLLSPSQNATEEEERRYVDYRCRVSERRSRANLCLKLYTVPGICSG